MTPFSGPILIAGATGALGGAVARRLLALGLPVHALGRDTAKLQALQSAGAHIVRADLRDEPAIERACRDVEQVLSTANNVMGAGPSSPTRVDAPGYATLCRAMKSAGVQRIVHVSAAGVGPDNPVDFFRVKYEVDQTIIASGVPYVIVKPAAFMETWVTMLIGDGIRTKGVATLFGDGRRVSSFIAMDDVAEFLVRILADPGVRNEQIRLGGPSTMSYEAIASEVERALGVRAKRRHVPVAILRYVPALIRPFNEVAARLMTMGYWSATTDLPCDDWAGAAARFGVQPMTVSEYLASKRTDDRGA